MIDFLSIFILVFSIFTITIGLIVNHDFLNREFTNYHEKHKWGKMIFNSFFGKFRYFYLFIIKNRLN